MINGGEWSVCTIAESLQIGAKLNACGMDCFCATMRSSTLLIRLLISSMDPVRVRYSEKSDRSETLSFEDSEAADNRVLQGMLFLNGCYSYFLAVIIRGMNNPPSIKASPM